MARAKQRRLVAMGATQACSATRARREENGSEDLDESPRRPATKGPEEEAFPLKPEEPPASTLDALRYLDVLRHLDAVNLRLDRLELDLQRKVQHEELDAKLSEVCGMLQPRQDLPLPTQIDSGLSGSQFWDEVALSVHPSSKRSKPKVPESLAQLHADIPHISEREKLVQAIIQKREIYRDDVQEAIRHQLRQFREQGFSDTDGNKATDLTDEQRNSIDEGYLMKQYAKDQICRCKTAREIFMKAELLIDEDWLDTFAAIPGNIFCLGAFGEIFPYGGKRISSASLKAYSKFLGCCLIIVIQLIGPALIFLSRMPGNLGVSDEDKYEWRCHPWIGLGGNRSEACPSGKFPGEVSVTDDWGRNASTKFLGIVFMLAFILNGLFSVIQEQQTWRDLYNTFRFLDWKNEDFKAPGAVYLGAGAFVNCWVILWSCLDMYVVAGACDNPQDLLLDALALLFLYRLDDVGGDLGFVDEDDWPGLRIAWIYNELVHPWPDDEFDEDQLDKLGCVCMTLYKMAIFLICVELVCIPVFAIVTPFKDIVG